MRDKWHPGEHPRQRRYLLATLAVSIIVTGASLLVSAGQPGYEPSALADALTEMPAARLAEPPGPSPAPTSATPSSPARSTAPTAPVPSVAPSLPAPTSTPSVPAPDAQPVSAECAASWGATGAPTDVLAVPAAPATDVCRPGAVRPVTAVGNCTVQVDGAGMTKAVEQAGAGDRICVRGTSDARLTVNRSGTATAPIQVLGTGDSTVNGITVQGDHVVVDGFTVTKASAPAIQLTGTGITVRNNVVTHPTGGDGDGIRFFGTDLRILHNTVSDVRNEGGAHADCMQTYATNTPTSENVLIHSNRCEKIDNQCLIAEGPKSREGDGSGEGRSSYMTFTGNYCEFGAAQAVMIDDVQNVTVTSNEIVGDGPKAFGFDNGSTGARVRDNKIAEGISYEVGMDSSSREGYEGPEVGGAPLLTPAN